MTPGLLAHGGGAPEAAMIALPLLLFGAFLYLERRARRREREAAEAAPPAAETDTPPPL